MNSSFCLTQPRSCVPSPFTRGQGWIQTPIKMRWAKIRNILTSCIPTRSDRHRHPIINTLNTDLCAACCPAECRGRTVLSIPDLWTVSYCSRQRACVDVLTACELHSCLKVSSCDIGILTRKKKCPVTKSVTVSPISN